LTPWGSKTGGQALRHLAVQGVLLAFRVYTVFLATRIEPSLAFVALEMTRAVVGLVAADAALEAKASADNPPTVKAATAMRPSVVLRIDARCPPVRFMS